MGTVWPQRGPATSQAVPGCSAGGCRPGWAASSVCAGPRQQRTWENSSKPQHLEKFCVLHYFFISGPFLLRFSLAGTAEHELAKLRSSPGARH